MGQPEEAFQTVGVDDVCTVELRHGWRKNEILDIFKE